MICAGDEFGRTQNGNNNAYCQDNETSWIHWEMDEERLSLVNFFRRLTAAFHLYPVFRRLRFLTGEMNPDLEVKDVSWIDANGSEMTAEAWDNGHALLRHAFGRARAGDGNQAARADTTLLIVFNAHHEAVEFTLPPCYEAEGWKRLFDTTDPQLDASQFDNWRCLRSDRALHASLRACAGEGGSPGGQVRRGPSYLANSTANGSGFSHSWRGAPTVASRPRNRSNQRASGNRARAFHVRLRLSMRGVARHHDGELPVS